ncbi:hypothetical protein EV122DRAFT_285254 [Schizophyllum commune]
MIDATFGEGEGVARSAARAANITPTAPSATATPQHLYLLPGLVNNFIRPFHVASSAPLHPFLKVKAPLSLKQRIFVRRAMVRGVEATYRRPPSKGSPRSLRVPPPPPPPMRSPLALPRRPLDVEATYRRPPSKALPHPFLRSPPSDDVRDPLGDALEPTSPLAAPSILVSNFNMSRARSEPRPLHWPLLSSPTSSVLVFARLDAFQPLGDG